MKKRLIRPCFFVKSGWRPGAISKRLLRALNEAKLRRSVVEWKQTKKSKKRAVEKPTLIITKKAGEYRVEMNVPPISNGNECSPHVYRIETANNKARMQKRERKQRRLIKATVNAIWSDPYHPQLCENICLPAYKQAIGVRDHVCKENDEADVLSSCSEDDISSSSSDVDWELQFSPPSALRKQIMPDYV